MSYIDRLEDLSSDPIWEVLEGENPCKDRRVYTASQISQISSCTWRWKLENMDRVMPETRNAQGIRGTAVHKAIHRLHSTRKWNDYQDVFDECWHEALNDPEESHLPFNTDRSDREWETVINDGRSMVAGYAQREANASVIACEVPFRMLLENPKTKTRYRFSGTVDQLRSIAAGIGILDLKTEAAEPNQPYLMRNPQFSGYTLALTKAVFIIDGEPVFFRQFPQELVWYHLSHLVPYKRRSEKQGKVYQAGDLRGDPRIEVYRTPGDCAMFEAEAMRWIQVIRFGLFARNVDKIGCSMCKVSTACTTGEAHIREDAVALANLDSLEV